MSARQIIEELPKLSREEREEISKRASDLNHEEAEAEEIAWAEACTLEGFIMMDKLEAANEA